MAYNEKVANRIRQMLAGHNGLTEQKMFGGIAFLLNGNMCCGVHKDDLILRIEPGRTQEALQNPRARRFDLTGRPMAAGWVLVGSGGYTTDAALQEWVRLAVQYVSSLPKK